MTRAETIALCNWAVGGLTPEKAEALADKVIAARARGENASVWHQCSLMFGHKCNCAQCNPRPNRAFRDHTVKA